MKLSKGETVNYTELYSLNNSGKAKVIKESGTGQLFVKKDLKVYDKSVYEFLTREKPAGIPRIYEYHESEEGLTVIEEYINGRTLKSLIEEKGPLPYEFGITIVKSIAEILSPLHNNVPPIVHRDIKPSNILLTDQGFVYLLDFNAATQYTESKDMDTVLIGTTGYAAPEQYGFKASDPRADIFALGRTAQDIFTGERTSPETYNGPIPEIIKKCLQMDPDNRYKNAEELLFELNKSTKDNLISHLPFSKTCSEIYSKTWLPPGFRTKKPWKIIIAILYYFFWAFSLYTSLSDSEPSKWLSSIVVVLFIFAETFFFMNYKGIHQALPLTNSDSIIKVILGLLLYGFFIYAITVLVYNLVSNVIGLG